MNTIFLPSSWRGGRRHHPALHHRPVLRGQGGLQQLLGLRAGDGPRGARLGAGGVPRQPDPPPGRHHAEGRRQGAARGHRAVSRLQTREGES